MNDDFQLISNELGRIPCPLCRHSMRLQLNMRILMTQYKYLCKHCKDKMGYIGDKMCICKETTPAPVVQEENELCKRIKNFFKSIVPSPRLIHKTKILPLLDEYNPFVSLSVPNFRDDDIKQGQMKISDSEPNLSGVRPCDDQPFHKYAETDLEDSKTHLGYKNVGKEDMMKSERESSATKLKDARFIDETTTDMAKDKMGDVVKYGGAEGKVKRGKDDEDKKHTDKEKKIAQEGAQREKGVDKEKVKKEQEMNVVKYGGAEGKVKKGKDDEDKKHTDKEKKIAQEGAQREKGVDKEKGKTEQETSKGKGGVEVKLKSKKGDDRGIDSKAQTGDKAKVVNEEKGAKGKSVDKGKYHKENEAIPLEGLSIEKMKAELQNKKAQQKETKGKGDGDKKTDKFGKNHFDESELEIANDKANNDQVAPLTYTEAVLPRVKEAEKVNPRENKDASKTLDFIHKLNKSPRVRRKLLRRALGSLASPNCNRQVSLLQLLNKPSPYSFKKVIVGNRLIKYKPPMPKFSECQEHSIAVNPNVIYVKYEENPAEKEKDRTEHNESKANNRPMGVLYYALSDRSYINKGITILPTEKIMRQLNVYRMRPSNPDNNWFVRNRHKNEIKYCSGQKLAAFDGDQRCRIYYKNGNLALDYYEAKEERALQRLVLYSDGENELKQKVPVTVLATFDQIGTGIIFDKKGNVRAKYNQNEGVVLDKTLGPYTKWKWHQLNDPPVLEEVMIESVLPVKDPLILRAASKDHVPKVVDEEVLEIEFQNSLKERGKKMFKSFKPFPVKIKAIKINDQFSLHIIDQSHINLTFRDGTTSFRIDVGMILDCNEIIDTETSEMGQVSVPFEQKPACSSSMLNLQRSVEQAQVIERKRLSRSKRQQPHVEPCASLERMRSVLSQPLRQQLQGHPCSCTQNYTYK